MTRRAAVVLLSLSELHDALVADCGWLPAPSGEIAERAVAALAERHGVALESWRGRPVISADGYDKLFALAKDEHDQGAALLRELDERDQQARGLVAPLATAMTDAPGVIAPSPGLPVIGRRI